MDNSHVALVSLWLKTDSFSEFRCDRDMTLGMNLGSLQKIIKCANNDDNCKLSASEDADTLNLQFQGKRKFLSTFPACAFYTRMLTIAVQNRRRSNWRV